MTNVIDFPSGKPQQTDAAPGIEAPKTVRRSHAELMANELFEKTMITLENTGVFDVLLEADDVGFEEVQPRIVLLREAMVSIFMFLEGEQHDLDGIADAMFEVAGIDHESLELVGNYNDKYMQKLRELAASQKP